MAHFNFSQPLHLQAEIGGEEGDLEYNTKPGHPGASPGAHRSSAGPQAMPRSSLRPGGAGAGGSLPHFNYPAFFWLLLSPRLCRAGARCGGAGVCPVPQCAQTHTPPSHPARLSARGAPGPRTVMSIPRSSPFLQQSTTSSNCPYEDVVMPWWWWWCLMPYGAI